MPRLRYDRAPSQHARASRMAASGIGAFNRAGTLPEIAQPRGVPSDRTATQKGERHLRPPFVSNLVTNRGRDSQFEMSCLVTR